MLILNWNENESNVNFFAFWVFPEADAEESPLSSVPSALGGDMFAAWESSREQEGGVRRGFRGT